MTMANQKLPGKADNPKPKFYFFLDLFCCCVIVAAALYLKVGPIDEHPSRRGFYCNDDTINKPFHANDKVSASVTTIIGLTSGAATVRNYHQNIMKFLF